jgi:hypothetical protein
MKIDLDELVRALEAAKADAIDVYERNKAAAEPSIGFDAGRYEGLKQAIEIVLARDRPRGGDRETH